MPRLQVSDWMIGWIHIVFVCLNLSCIPMASVVAKVNSLCSSGCVCKKNIKEMTADTTLADTSSCTNIQCKRAQENSWRSSHDCSRTGNDTGEVLDVAPAPMEKLNPPYVFFLLQSRKTFPRLWSQGAYVSCDDTSPLAFTNQRPD